MRGLAGIKLSGSLNIYGFIKVNINKNKRMKKNPTISLNVKYGWKGDLSIFLFKPIGLFDPN